MVNVVPALPSRQICRAHHLYQTLDMDNPGGTLCSLAVKAFLLKWLEDTVHILLAHTTSGILHLHVQHHLIAFQVFLGECEDNRSTGL